MNVSLYSAASGLNATSHWHEVISENIASSHIPGYKKQDLAFSKVSAGLIGPIDPGSSATVAVAPKADPQIAFEQGSLRLTDVPTDLAIEGPGFFEIQLGNGLLAYTRDGEFHVDLHGQLVTKEGYHVLGEGGPIQLDPNNHDPIHVAQDGTISQGNQSYAKLKIVTFPEPERLTPMSRGFFLARDPFLQPTESTSRLHQGFLENANTNAVSEMVGLIAAMRAFEANQRVVQTQDQRMGQSIQTLGTTS